MSRVGLKIALLVGLLSACDSKDLLAEIPDAAVVYDAAPACQPILFLNREPTIFSPGAEDPVLNDSSIVSTAVMTTGSGLDDASWQSVVGCVGELLQPFGIVVTELDPGNVDHIEVAFSQSPEDIGFNPGSRSVTPFACGGLRRGVAFEFSGSYAPDDLRLICEDVTEMVGHFAGLDHSFQCQDVMSWLYGCGNETFLDQEAPCGEVEARPCQCTDLETQNSFQTMTDWFGSYCDGE